MNNNRHLFFLMNHVFVGFGLAVLFGVLPAVVVWQLEGVDKATEFTTSFFNDFRGAISGGLIFSAAILVWRSQAWIPDLLDETFGEEFLGTTSYPEQKRRFLSTARSVSFASSFVVVGLGLFSLAEYPLDGLSHYALLSFGCIQYALGVYIGRKLFYIAQMLHAIEGLDPPIDVFTDDKLGPISTYVNSLSTLTVVFVFAHVYTYYSAPFVYGSPLGESVRSALLLPAVLAVPVVAIFNFYPRTVLRTEVVRQNWTVC